MIRKRTGIVESIINDFGYVTEVLVLCEGKLEKAISYTYLTGKVEIKDVVVLNTNAVNLDLGTGGYHFIIHNLNNNNTDFSSDKGHIQKLRYTPVQVKVKAIEEKQSEFHDTINNNDSINNLKVIICPLHSMIIPVCSYLKYKYNYNIVYIMTDTASLPAAFSKSIRMLKEKGFINCSVTTGQSFGGDYESINIYSSLIFAYHCKKADAAVIAPGPGIVGTSTVYGFSGIDEGHTIDIVNNLNGNPFLIPRISFCDKRKSHLGISHHTITVLSKISYSKANVAFPILKKNKHRFIYKQIKDNNIDKKHNIFFMNDNIINFLEKNNIKVETMGKDYIDNPEFFKAVGATVNLIRKM